MHSELIRVATGSREVVHDLTETCRRFVAESAHAAHGDGLLHVFVPHATAGVAILETLLPRDFGWRHRHGSPGHGRDHVLPALIPPYASIPVIARALMLGTWQSVCLIDTN